MKVPVAVGVPLIVITLVDQTAITPAGKLVAVPMPVAPVVVIVIDGVKAVFTVNVGLDDAVPAVFGVHETVIVPVAFTMPQPPVKRLM